MLFYYNLPIRFKLLLAYAIVFLTILMLSFGLLFLHIKSRLEHRIEEELNRSNQSIANMVLSSATVSIKYHLQGIAEKNIALVSRFYDAYTSGRLSEADAKSKAVRELLNQVVGETGYLYCLNSEGTIVVHPREILLGQDFSHLDFIKAQMQQKEGYLEYHWKNPVEPVSSPKALYMTYFEPWDWIISVTSYKSEFSQLVSVDDFKDRVLSLSFGESGYSAILNMEGEAVIHPEYSGSMLDVKDSDGNLIVREMIQRKRGFLTYNWKNPSDYAAREKFLAFDYIPDFGWIIASTSYTDEIYSPLDDIERTFLLTLVLALVTTFGVTLAVSTSITRPLTAFILRFEKVTKGDWSTRLDDSAQDEIGNLAKAFNYMTEAVNDGFQKIQAQNVELTEARKNLEDANKKLERMNEELEVRVAERTSQLVEAREQAESANRAKSEFLANMSHEIRTPMNAVLGFTEILREIEGEPKKKDLIDKLHLSGKELLSLINDILDLSKIEAGKLELQYGVISIHSLFEEVENFFSREVGSKGLEFIVDIDKDVPESLMLDRTRLKQVIINLVGNAIKFSDNGYIRLAAGGKKSDSGSGNRFDLILEVEDTGIGIAEDQQAKIFQAFEQSAVQESMFSDGTGLGLAISSRLVEMMEGRILVESGLGKGATFTIHLSGVESIADNLALSIRENQLDVDTIIFDAATILIADDISYNREILSTFLDNRKFTLIYAENGEETIEMAQNHTIDLLLLDMKMPVMDGYEVSAALKSDHMTKDIPIIAVTASALKHDEEMITRICDGYLRKPVTRQDLFHELMRFIPYVIDQRAITTHLS